MHCDASRTCFGLLNKLQGCSLKVEHAQGSEAVELGTWKSLAFLNHFYDSYLSLEKTTKRSRRSRKRAINFGKPKIQNVFLLLQQLLKAHLHDARYDKSIQERCEWSGIAMNFLMQSGFTSKECKFKKEEAEQAPPANDTDKLCKGSRDFKAKRSECLKCSNSDNMRQSFAFQLKARGLLKIVTGCSATWIWFTTSPIATLQSCGRTS